MAIGFARIEFVKRSQGKTSCAKAAYNSRSKIEFQGNCALPPETYDWSNKEPSPYHAILLPKWANEKFKDKQLLWNAAEVKEKKHNSQVATELLLALPDDKMITLEDRIHLTNTFVQKHFIEKGLAAQIDIHPPEKRIKITSDHREIGLFKEMTGNVIAQTKDSLTVQFDSKRTITFNPKEFTGFVEMDNNWHAHVLITTRRFKSDGLDFEDAKARDLMPKICKGKVVSGDDWGKLWTDHQNNFFQEKGLNLRVDSLGIEPQEHLGPVRMRGRAFSLLEEHAQILDRNAIKVKNPAEVLAKITERQSIFTKEDVDHFMQKHIPLESQAAFLESFWKQKDLVPLIDKQTGEITGKYSSQKVIDEEAAILRIADKLHAKPSFPIEKTFSNKLNPEQKLAFNVILEGSKISCLQGYAGTGKSHLLAALKDAYTHSGYNVRAFGPDNATADVLKEKGFQNAENVYRFLYGLHHSRRNAIKNNEVWIVDEAGKLGNRPLLELLKAAHKQNAQLIFAGDHAQLTSVERGGMFQIFTQRYPSPILQDIQRQKEEKQREISKNLALGQIGSAIDKLSSASTIKWASSKKDAIEALVSKWALDTRANPKATTLLIAHSNDEVRVLNEMVRIIKKQRGELEEKEFACETTLGKVYLSVGDQIEFRKNDKILGVTNGLSGTLIKADKEKFTVSLDKKRTVTFNPQEYSSYQLGYASTYFRSQGKTVDLAYVLHSQALNKRLFYVGLTRHAHEAYYFVSKDQAYCLSDLKRQALRENSKETTLSYTTQEPDTFLRKIKTFVQDKTRSKEFFNPTPSAPSPKAKIEELEPLKSILIREKNAHALETEVSNVGHFEPKERRSTASIKDELEANIEPLLYKLFPDGPYCKNKHTFRFGNKGSLSVVVSGEKTGQFFDFERQEGGHILKLIQRELGLGNLEALEWSKQFLGIAPELTPPKSFQKPAKTTPEDWVSLIPKGAAPPLEALGKLHHYFKETARHAYRDENGEVLYYRLRLIDKNDPNKKITPPLSFGYWKSNPSAHHWELKGFNAEKQILYNLPDLKKYPSATVLIVEGEKTADKALSKFPSENLVSITWPGGAGAARRADWSPLVGREVIIWPDNDKPGFQAGEDICRELRKIGVQSIQLIDPTILQKNFPPKWDLADPVPSGVNLKQILLSPIEKGIDPKQVLYRLSSIYKDDPIDRARVNEVLWRVDERLRPELKNENFWKIRDTILTETANLLLRHDPTSRLSWQLLIFEAQHGKKPTIWELEKIQETLKQLHPYTNGKINDLAIDKALTSACEKMFSGVKYPEKQLQKDTLLVAQSLEIQENRLRNLEKTVQPKTLDGPERGTTELHKVD